MPLTKEKRKLSKLIQQSDSEESDHELSHYMNDRIKLMKEVLKIVKPKKIKLMSPSCLKNFDIEEINSMLLEELLGISNKRLKYIFNGQSLDEDSSSTTSEEKPIDIISLDDISDDDLVINLDDGENVSQQRKKRKEIRHHKCKKEKIKNSVKEENEISEKKVSEKGSEIDSNKNLMSVLELLELQARARAIKSQLLLENAKTQEMISLSKIPTLEEKVGSDDEVIIKTAKTEEIIITSSDEEVENRSCDHDKQKLEKEDNVENEENISKNVASNDDSAEKLSDTVSQNKIKIIENKELPSSEFNIKEILNITENKIEKINEIDQGKITESDGIIQINLSDDEMDEMK